ncbi:MAG TPA: hypothetical protein PLF85_08720, partial [Turneriella sp.]|nr:hypothetical protein [Turneriella sp.]
DAHFDRLSATKQKFTVTLSRSKGGSTRTSTGSVRRKQSSVILSLSKGDATIYKSPEVPVN